MRPARVPGTAAVVEPPPSGAAEPDRRFDECDWWFRTGFDADPAAESEEVVLELDGIATVADVFLNGERILSSGSMFAQHSIEIGSRLRGENQLAIRCHALAPLLAERRRPRARWRTNLVEAGNLRFFRTMILGRAPGFAPGPAAVGPWRPVRLRRRTGLAVDELTLRTDLRDGLGLLSVDAKLRALDRRVPRRVEAELSGPSGSHRAELELTVDEEGVVASGRLQVPDVARWWPHTHGEPALHQVRLLVDRGGDRMTVDGGRVGFRTISAGADRAQDVEADGLHLHLNGVGVFARGAVWTPIDWPGLAPSAAALRGAVEAARDAGMNILRVPGTATYESPAFHDLCDELGMLVWQDFMFANLDYPIDDEGFRALVDSEAAQVAACLAGRPSTAVFCGNSEVEQQAAMFGLEPEVGRGELFYELLPGALDAAGSDAVYVPSAPSGGDLPFRPDRGVASYFGVGGYRRPLEDARRAGVRFAAECLAFANVPAEATIAELLPRSHGELPIHDPAWKAGVPRDVGTGWDFDDVRDHYLEAIFGVDPVGLRSVDNRSYLELSRAVTGEVMAEVFGEWRRRGSRCGGGIVLWMQDLVAGAGWGLVDHRGEPKAVYQHLRRALAPVAVWTTDEGLGGIVAHVANDRPEPLAARLRVVLYRDLEQRVGEAEELLELAPHGGLSVNVEALLGRFVDAAWAYRFGPPAQDLIVVTLEGPESGEPISQSFRFPAGRPIERDPVSKIGLEAAAGAADDGVMLRIRSRRLAYGVRVHADGFMPTDDAFSVEPGGERTVLLRTRGAGTEFAGGTLSALNVDGNVRIAPPGTEP
jgi:beta-mannosidase